MKQYDVIILGAGPAGLTASIYAVRSGLKTLVIENKMVGGQATLTYEIKNYPGFESISGMDLTMQMQAQAENLGVEFEYDTVEDINLNEKTVTTSMEQFSAKAIILAMGASARKIGAKNEDELTGKGVAYCAVCDGAFFKDEDVVMVGGGNSAIEDAIYLSKIAKSVTIVNNLPNFTCQEILKEELEKTIKERKNISIIQGHMIKEMVGKDKLEKVIIASVDGVETGEIPCAGCFVAIGRKPDTDMVREQIELDSHGYIKADENMHTSIDGVFVAGDIRVKNLRQIITACADGAIAGTEANAYINTLK